jgi:hypothetical protein
VTRARNLPDGVVDVIAERLPALIAIEERRKHAKRKRRRHEERIALQRRQDHVADCFSGRRPLCQLLVPLRARRLRAGGDFAVHPVSRVEQFARARYLFRAQEIGNREQHPFLRSARST